MKYRIILFLNLEIVESLISFLPNKLKSYCGNYLRAYGNLGFVQKLLQNTFHIQEHVAIAQVLQRRQNGLYFMALKIAERPSYLSLPHLFLRPCIIIPKLMVVKNIITVKSNPHNLLALF